MKNANIRIVPFIFNWKNQFEKARQTEASLKEVADQVFVINSDQENTCHGWIDVGEQAYFTTQFFRAIDLFDGDILFHIQADASYHNWPAVFESALQSFSKYNWGVFAPNVDFTPWKSPGVDIGSNYFSEPGLSLVSCTDCTCWFIHKKIIQEFEEHKTLFANNRYGWGIDLTMATLSYYNHRPVIRDYNHTVVHPRGRGYDNQAATVEFKTFINEIDEELRPVFNAVRNDRQTLTEYLKTPIWT